MPYLWNGQIYETQSEVAEAARCCRATIINHLNRYGHLENIGNLNAGMPPKTDRNNAVLEMRKMGLSFGEISKRFGMSRSNAYRIVRAGQ